jgi:hypothetical protein
VNRGTIEFPLGCGNAETLDLHGAMLENRGTIVGENFDEGTHSIEGSLVNDRVVSLGPLEKLRISGSYAQAATGTLKTAIEEPASFGALSVGTTATIAGNLVIAQTPSFKPSLGETFDILESASREGSFARERGGVVSKSLPGLYYLPTYTPTGVTLLVEQAAIKIMPAEGAPGSGVTVEGSGFPPEDTITVSFTDHEHVKTVFPSVTTNSSGEFSTAFQIPPLAAVGKGKVTASSRLTGVSARATFKVT